MSEAYGITIAGEVKDFLAAHGERHLRTIEAELAIALGMYSIITETLDNGGKVIIQSKDGIMREMKYP